MSWISSRDQNLSGNAVSVAVIEVNSVGASFSELAGTDRQASAVLESS